MSAEAPKGNQGCLPGFLRRLFASPQDLQSTQQLPEQSKPLNQVLDEIDRGRELDKNATAVALLREQEAKEKAIQQAWDKAKALEISIKDYLAVADPVITEGLSIISRRTWGDGGFTIIKSGPSWCKSGAYAGFTMMGVDSAITGVNLFDSEAAEPPPLGYLSGAEFRITAQYVDRDKIPAYDAFAGHYNATLKFSNGKPQSLQFGYGIALNEEELKILGREDVLTRALGDYYHHGPEVMASFSES